jgi:CRP/FNR family transcriptional regulator, cyclic AMP receptor protein
LPAASNHVDSIIARPFARRYSRCATAWQGKGIQLTTGFASFPLFAGLDPAGIADLERIALPFDVAAREILFRQGDQAEGLYLLRQGRISLSSRAPGDEANTLVPVEPGAFLGELALLDGGLRAATAVAGVASAGWLIPAELFDFLLRDARPVAVEAMQRIRETVARRLRDTIAAIAALPPEISQTGIRMPGISGSITPADADVAAMLASLPTFAALGEIRCLSIAAMGPAIAAMAGTRISSPGEAAAHLYIVLRGALRTALPRPGGCEQLLVHAPGDLVGLVALIDGGLLASELMVREDAILLRVDRTVFLDLRNRDADLAHKLFLIANRQLVRDLRRLNRHLGRARSLMAFNDSRGAG